MTHVGVRDVLGLYALGSLDGADAVAVASHLDGCRACTAELLDMEATAAELARMPRPLSPSAEMTRRVLDAAKPALADVPARRSRHRRRWRFVPIAASLAGVAIIGLLLVSHLRLQRQLDRAAAMLGRGRDLLEFMASPGVVTVSLAATDARSGARALVSYDRRSGRVVVLAFDLPSPPAGHIYQLWRIAAGVRSGMVFSTDARGGTLLRERWVPEEGDIPVFAVTLEPSPGVDDPTGQILLLGGRTRPRDPYRDATSLQ